MHEFDASSSIKVSITLLKYSEMIWLTCVCGQCVEKVAHSNCPVCLENLHTSTHSLTVLQCGHVTHKWVRVMSVCLSVCLLALIPLCLCLC